MNTLLIYIAKVAFYMAAFYLVYFALLKNDTMYRRNRAFILFSIFSSLLLPFIIIKANNPVGIPFFGKTLGEIIVYGYNNRSLAPLNELSGISYLKLFWLIYLIGFALFGLKLMIDFIELLYLIFIKKTGKSNIIKFHGLNTSGFSALGYVFINTRLTPEESVQIIKHEQNHIDHNHFPMVQSIHPYV